MTRFLDLSLINANWRSVRGYQLAGTIRKQQGDHILELYAASWYGHFASVQSKKDSHLLVPITLIFLTPCVTCLILLHPLIVVLKSDFLLRFLWDYKNMINRWWFPGQQKVFKWMCQPTPSICERTNQHSCLPSLYVFFSSLLPLIYPGLWSWPWKITAYFSSILHEPNRPAELDSL